MKTNFLILSLLVITCAGCMTRYDITLANGTVITSKSRPRLTPDKDAWMFTDPSGRALIVPAGSVAQIAPQSLDDGGPTKWHPASSR
jgi:hypothetical protein